MGTSYSVRALRWSLLASLGLLPAACGGSSKGNGPESKGNEPKCTTGDPNSGIVTCDEGYSFKATSTRCQPGAIDPESSLPPLPGMVDCTNDESVCDAFRLSYCGGTAEPSANRYCATGCASDSDCSDGATCECQGAPYGVCVLSYCDSDADCEPGYHCASSSQGCGNSAYRCQSAEDACFGTQDCLGKNGYSVCFDNGSQRQCSSGSVCGRPFLVEDTARVAPTCSRTDWADQTAPATQHLSPDERAALAEHWTKMGQLEHASIAAFARFQLQLLALGAPPELVERCNQALADETAHTQLCFGIASAYAGRAIGPGPLDIANSLDSFALLDVVDLVLAEGCFGETGAALEALEAARTATDPVIRAAYERIAADEERHAELAFRFVRWALERGADSVGERIELALHELGSHPARDIAVPCLRALLAHRSLAKVCQRHRPNPRFDGLSANRALAR